MNWPVWQAKLRHAPNLRRTVPWVIVVHLLTFAIQAAETPTRSKATDTPDLRLLTNAQEVLRVGVENAQRFPHPVSLRGVVTCHLSHSMNRGTRWWFYLQDETAAVLVIYTNSNLPPETGCEVAVTGRVFKGQFAVHVSDASVTVIGPGTMPQPKRADPSRMTQGEDFGHWVVVEGRVVEAYSFFGTAILRLASGEEHFKLFGPSMFHGAFPAESPPLDWLDARLEVRGICWTTTDQWNRPNGFRIHAPSTNYVTIIEPGTNDVFAKPITAIASLRPGQAPLAPRVRVVGTVTHWVAEDSVFLQDDSAAVQAQILAPLGPSSTNAVFRDRSHLVPLEPGDRVEVVGHVVQRGVSPVLIDGEYRRLGRGPSLSAAMVSATGLDSGIHDKRLISVRARMLDQKSLAWRGKSEESLTLAAPDTKLQATLRSAGTNSLPKFPRNALLQVSGVCNMEFPEYGGLPVAHLLMRSAADVTMVREPMPWESLQPGRILAVSGGLGALALVWIGLLRRQVAQRKQAEEKARRSEQKLRGLNTDLEQRVAERTDELRESESRYRAVITHAPQGIVVFDADSRRFTDVNENALHIFGLTREEFLAPPTPALTLSPDEPGDGARQLAGIRDRIAAVPSGQTVEFEWTHRAPAGKEIPLAIRLAPLPVFKGRFFIAVVTDITDRKRAEAELQGSLAQEKELSELKSRFVSMVSHEFRTPLGIILSSAEILQDYLERLPPERRKEHLRDIAHCAEQMGGTMEDLLFLSRAEAGRLQCKPAPLDLPAFCQRLVDQVVSTTGRRCSIELKVTSTVGLATAAGDDPMGSPDWRRGAGQAMADESLLRHIFTNLLSNAVKYSPAGTLIEFTLEHQEQRARFTVRDGGIGIPEPDRHQLFQAFYRGGNVGETPGTGLGLTIVKHCVELHGGTIEFASEEGQGTTFVVNLPLPLPLMPTSPDSGGADLKKDNVKHNAFHS